MAVRAMAKNVGISPKKLALITEAVQGKRVEEALNILRFMHSPAAQRVARVVRSATANAENNLQLNPAELRIVKIQANSGVKLKRFRPRSRGRAGKMARHYSHITVVVEEVA